MTETPTALTTRKRCRKVRTRTVSSMEPLVLSKLPMSAFELAPGREHMICPNCKTWCPITGMGKGGMPKLVPHHTEAVGADEPQRCKGSNRLVTADVSLDKWRRYRAEGATQTDGRRSTKVLRKPKVPTVAPVHRLIVPLPTTEGARQTYLGHRERCAGCTATATCPDGLRLAAAYAALQLQEPKRSEMIARLEKQEAELHQQALRGARRQRPQQWERALPSVEAADRQRNAAASTAVVGSIEGLGLPLLEPGTETVGQKRRRK